MTLSDLTSKKPEELNVMCAESIGWKGIEVYEDNQGPPITHGYPPPTVGVDAHGNWEAQPPEHTKRLPNYTGSWDAIMPEVRKLTKEQRLLYIQQLYETTKTEWLRDGATKLPFADPQEMTIALILTLHP